MSADERNAEASTFLADHPTMKHVDLLLGDSNGILRGKRIPTHALEKVYRDGICLPGSLFACDIQGNTIEASGLGYDEGDRDRICRPVPGTLVPVPWQPFEPAGQLLMSMYEENGTPFFADPRQVLAGVLQRICADGLTPVVAVELEFYLLDREPDEAGYPQTPLSGATGKRARDTQVYSLKDLDRYAGLLGEIAEVCELQHIPADAAVAEYAPAQFEINLNHVPDACQACDHAVMLKRAIRAVAARYGLRATFMAKPWAERAGSGMHVHVSLLDRQGNNVFAGAGQEVNDALRHAIGGLAATLSESFALLAPNANSYRRFQRDQYVPLSASWGVNNRTVAIRIPAGTQESRRFEHRVAGADANPYLVVAAILAGMHHGLQEKLEPVAPVTGNAYEQESRDVPESWLDALNAFDAGRVLRTYLGAPYVEFYSVCRRVEREQFNRPVSAREVALYLDTV